MISGGAFPMLQVRPSDIAADARTSTSRKKTRKIVEHALPILGNSGEVPVDEIMRDHQPKLNYLWDRTSFWEWKCAPHSQLGDLPALESVIIVCLGELDAAASRVKWQG